MSQKRGEKRKENKRREEKRKGERSILVLQPSQVELALCWPKLEAEVGRGEVNAKDAVGPCLMGPSGNKIDWLPRSAASVASVASVASTLTLVRPRQEETGKLGWH